MRRILKTIQWLQKGFIRRGPYKNADELVANRIILCLKLFHYVYITDKGKSKQKIQLLTLFFKLTAGRFNNNHLATALFLKC